MRLLTRALANAREGRLQKLLSGMTAFSVPSLAFEINMEHYKGSFGDKRMWTPIVLTPALSALYALDGAIGVITHLRGVQKRPGGLSEPTYNLVMGPPLLAPGSLCLVGALGILAAVVKREK